MSRDMEMLDFICKNAEMGRDNLHHVLKRVEDPALHKALKGQMQEYQNTYTAAGRLLNQKGHKPAGSSVVAKAMSHMMVDMKIRKDPSPSAIAEMVIQGSTMGITKMTQRLHRYEGNNRTIVRLAKQQIATEQSNIEEMKPFL